MALANLWADGLRGCATVKPSAAPNAKDGKTVQRPQSLAEILADNHLDRQAYQTLATATSATLYSLDPLARSSWNPGYFHGVRVLGTTSLDKNETLLVASKILGAVEAWDGLLAACFNPRHALRVRSDGRIYDFVLCYECQQVEVYRNDCRQKMLGITG